MSRVDHFEIAAADPEPVVAFYEDTFGWTAEEWEGPVDYWLLWTDDGIDGAVMPREGPDPAPEEPVSGYICALEVEDVEAALETVEANGGRTVDDPKMIPEVGRHAYAADPAGNQFGLLEPIS